MKNTLKVCANCRQIKLTSAFGTDKTHKDGLQSWCRSCKAAWARQYYRTTKGKQAHNRSRRQIEITVESGVATITKAPNNIDIVITDLDSKEQDHYYGTNMWQRIDLESEVIK